jgi:hypothetical protein
MFKENKISKITNPILRAFRRVNVIRSCNDIKYVLADSEMRSCSRLADMHVLLPFEVGLRICLKRLK